MVVIGEGATILLAALIGGVLLSGMVCQILLRHENTRRYEDSANTSRFVRRREFGAKLAFVFVLTLVLYVLYSRMLSAGRLYGPALFGRRPTECLEQALRHQLNLWPDCLIPALIFVAGVVGGGGWVYRCYQI